MKSFSRRRSLITWSKNKTLIAAQVAGEFENCRKWLIANRCRLMVSNGINGTRVRGRAAYPWHVAHQRTSADDSRSGETPRRAIGHGPGRDDTRVGDRIAPRCLFPQSLRIFFVPPQHIPFWTRTLFDVRPVRCADRLSLWVVFFPLTVVFHHPSSDKTRWSPYPAIMHAHAR